MARAMDRDTSRDAATTVADIVRAALEARGGLSPEDAVELLTPLADALDSARVAGVSAPRAGGDDGAVLAALGLGADVTPAAGPAPFRAPELTPGSRPSARSDVYAIAGLLRTAVTGQSPPPWTLSTLPPADGARALGPRLSALLWDALADDPMQRPVTPSELLARAQEAVAGDAARPQTSAPSPSAGGGAAAAALRPPRAVLVGLGALAAFVVGIIVAVASGGTATPAAPDPIRALPQIDSAAIATGQQVAFATAMRETMRKLNTRRIARRTRLARARTSTGQARAATSLGDAYGLAARSVAATRSPERALLTKRGIAAMMRDVEAAYRTLAAGARDGDAAAFARGRELVRRREAFLQRRIQGLERVGYVVA